MAADELTLQSESVSVVNQGDESVSMRNQGDASANFQRKIGSLRFVDTRTESKGDGRHFSMDNGSYTFSPVLSGINKADIYYCFLYSAVYITKYFPYFMSAIENEQDLLHTTIHSRAEDIVKMRGNRQELIVIATLLGRIPNLAGLARTCEVPGLPS